MPSTVIFRWSDNRIDKVSKKRIHDKLSRETDTKPITDADERSAPTEADDTYRAWANYLRTKTRDTKKFNLLFRENTSYGFRRNLWGLKPAGLTIAVIFSVIFVALYLVNYFASGQISEKLAAGGITNIISLSFWTFIINPKWVLTPADAYAERLAEAIDLL